MNFYLNDRSADFELDNRELKFYPNDRKIEFQLNGTQARIDGEGWVISTGIWNDNEVWDDNGIWNDGN